MFALYNLLFHKHVVEKFYKSLQCLLDLFFQSNNDDEFQRLANWLICELDFFLHDDHVLSLYLSCLLYCPDTFPGTNDWDYNKKDYRIYDKHITLVVFFQMLTHMINGVRDVTFFPILFVHSHQAILLPSKSNKHLGHLIFPPLTRTVQRLLKYTCIAYQTPVLVCHSPAVASSAGKSIYSNYIMEMAA